MSRSYKLFIGPKIREIRISANLNQADFAKRLGISASYYNQIENNQRHITAGIIIALAEEFNVNVASLSLDSADRMLANINEIVADPIFENERPSLHEIKLVAQNAPSFAKAFIELHNSMKKANDQLAEMDNSIVSTGTSMKATAYEEVRDFFLNADNYIDEIDRAAEALSFKLKLKTEDTIAQLTSYMNRQHNIEVILTKSMGNKKDIRKYDKKYRKLSINSTLMPSTIVFQIAFQIAIIEQKSNIDKIIKNANFKAASAAEICSISLANYFAGALLLPYNTFLESAKEMRNDIDGLAIEFGASFEQVAHRLSTLQRSGKKGVPFFFAKIDQAGNITKRHSATKLQFARYGAACPLWNAHQAFETPNKINRQIAETPDGIRYISIAIEIAQRPTGYGENTKRFALAIGCEVKYASQFVYADNLNLQSIENVTPIGISCRICERPNCIQRAVPPSHAKIQIDLNYRSILPYKIYDIPQ